MKKLLVLFSLLTITACVYAQDKNILKLPVPHYKILRPDSTYTTWTALKKNKPVILIYFMPDCPHCQHLMSELRPKMEIFKNMQIVMICAEQTKYPYMKVLKNFSRDFDLSKYKNITMGTEYPNYTVYTYLHVKSTPFVAFYDHNGKMVKYFDKQPKAEDIIAAAKTI